MDRVALYLQDDLTLHDALEFVRYAEARGFEAVWQAETRLVRDSAIAMAAFATATSRLKIGSGVMNIWTRNAATMASEFLTLDDLAPDRILCGLGACYDPLAAQVGVNRQKYLLAMREVVTAVRHLLTLQPVTYQGQYVKLDRVLLDVQHGSKRARRVPIFIGATGPKMMALAGEIADGILLNYLVSPQYNAMALQQIETGAHKAGRSVHDIDRPQLIVCSVAKDRAIALDAARRMIVPYLMQQPQLMRANGIAQGVIEAVTQVLSQPHPHQMEQAMRLIPDEAVQMITASGTPDEVRAKVQEYVHAGATCPVLYPLRDVRLLIDTFATGYSQERSTLL